MSSARWDTLVKHAQCEEASRAFPCLEKCSSSTAVSRKTTVPPMLCCRSQDEHGRASNEHTPLEHYALRCTSIWPKLPGPFENTCGSRRLVIQCAAKTQFDVAIPSRNLHTSHLFLLTSLSFVTPIADGDLDDLMTAENYQL